MFSTFKRCIYIVCVHTPRNRNRCQCFHPEEIQVLKSEATTFPHSLCSLVFRFLFSYVRFVSIIEYVRRPCRIKYDSICSLHNNKVPRCVFLEFNHSFYPSTSCATNVGPWTPARYSSECTKPRQTIIVDVTRYYKRRQCNAILFLALPFFLDKPYCKSRVAWLEDELALLVSWLSEAKGLGIVDERRAETAVWVARYQAD